MKYVVLHRNGTQWMNYVGNSLHVPFIDAESPEQAVEKAIERANKSTSPMYLVLSPEGWVIVTPQSEWKVEPF